MKVELGANKGSLDLVGHGPRTYLRVEITRADMIAGVIAVDGYKLRRLAEAILKRIEP